VYSYQARHELGAIYARQGRAAEAEAQWRGVLAERPDYTDAWLRLGELWGAQGRRDLLAELEQAARRMEAGPHRPDDVLLLRVGAHLGRKEFAAAAQVANAAIAQNPQALMPRVVLSNVYLQEGRDWDAAERALRGVLAVDPNNASAQHNLAVLARIRSQQGPPR
jgi:tetratricopeptide (TPR) repeat protein